MNDTEMNILCYFQGFWDDRHKVNILIHCNLARHGHVTLSVTLPVLLQWSLMEEFLIVYDLVWVNSVKYTSNNPVMCKSHPERHGHVSLIVTLLVCDLVRHGHITLIVTLPVSGSNEARVAILLFSNLMM